jgi:glutamate--cysteine ligase
MSLLEARLRSLPPALLVPLRGIEKEGLRVRPDGSLALTSHPAGLGSALTHPFITTDFSESQLELITAAHPDASVSRS